MAARKRPTANTHLQEAMALLIRNQAAFVEQIARNDQERLTLQRRSDERELDNKEWRRRTEEWMRKSDERFDRIEKRLSRIETILVQLPKALKKEIGFKTT